MNPTSYRTTKVDGLSIFCREAGPTNAETILLLHGLPSSSRMFEPLFARLSDRYHLIAPDYPGFGHSAWPDPKKFAYTFDHLAETMSHFTEALGLSRHTLYMQDYGGPVGFRMALEHPERVEAFCSQAPVVSDGGLHARGRACAPRRNRSRPGAPRSRPLDRRILFSESASHRRYPSTARFAATSAIPTVISSKSDRAPTSRKVTSARLPGQVGVTSGIGTAFPLDGGTRDGMATVGPVRVAG